MLAAQERFTSTAWSVAPLAGLGEEGASGALLSPVVKVHSGPGVEPPKGSLLTTRQW